MDPLLRRAAAVMARARRTRTVTQALLEWADAQRELREIWRNSAQLRKLRTVLLEAGELDEAVQLAHREVEALHEEIAEAMSRGLR